MLTNLVLILITSKNQSKTGTGLCVCVGTGFLQKSLEGIIFFPSHIGSCPSVIYWMAGIQCWTRASPIQWGFKLSWSMTWWWECKLFPRGKSVFKAWQAQGGLTKTRWIVVFWAEPFAHLTEAAGSTTIDQLYMAPTVYNRQTRTDGQSTHHF